MQERHIALNDVIVACRDAAEQLSANADLIDDAEIVAAFGDLIEQHRSVAREIAAHVRNLDALPREPDVELEQVQQLVTRLKARMSVNESLTVLDERIAAEEHIDELVGVALQLDLPESIVNDLCAARDVLRQGRHRLIALRRKLPDG